MIINLNDLIVLITKKSNESDCYKGNSVVITQRSTEYLTKQMNQLQIDIKKTQQELEKLKEVLDEFVNDI